MGEDADAQRQRDRIRETVAPGLEIRVAQPLEPGVVRGEAVDLLEEPERHDERRERMRDRRVSPVEDAQAVVQCVHIRHVQVVVLDRIGDAVRVELGAELGKTRCKRAQRGEVLAFARERLLEEAFELLRQGCEPEVGDAVGEVVLGVRHLAPLELGVEREQLEPRLRRIAHGLIPEGADRHAGVGEQQPGSFLVVGEHLRDPVRPAREELSSQPCLERMRPRALLEPDDTIIDRYPEHRPPGMFVGDLDRPARGDVRADPLLGGGEIHTGTMRIQHQYCSALMTKFVVDSSAVLQLASTHAKVSSKHKLLAPTLLRSQVLAALYEAADRGKLPPEVAREQLTRIRQMKIRLLGDAVLQRRAWQLAEQLGWDSTYDAEYVALTQLQADAFVTLDKKLERSVKRVVTTASIDDLL